MNFVLHISQFVQIINSSSSVLQSEEFIPIYTYYKINLTVTESLSVNGRMLKITRDPRRWHGQ